MKKLKLYLWISLLGILLPGCSTAPTESSVPEEIPMYSGEIPKEDVPYYENLEPDASFSHHVPENLLTAEQAKSRFQKLGFTTYTEESTESGLSYTASSDTGQVTLFASENGIIRTIQYAVSKEPQENAFSQIFRFLSIASGQELSTEEQNKVRECFTKTDGKATDVSSIKLKDLSFLLWINAETQEYAVRWE